MSTGPGGLPGIDTILHKGVSGLAGGIGLVSESVTAYRGRRKEKKQQQQKTYHVIAPSPSGPLDENHGPYVSEHAVSLDERRGLEHQEPQEPEDLIEEQWELDDAQDDLPPEYSIEEDSSGDHHNFQGELVAPKKWSVNKFLARYPPPQSFSDRTLLPQLSLPVILPQRRPKDRTRGFIRAYAPALEPCGIDQQMFLDFLETFERSSEANPWIQAINLATIGTMFVPELTSILVSLAIQAAVKIATEAHGRYKTNAFLDKINNEFFRPRGLYCLVLTWKPESAETTSEVNLTTTISSSFSPKHSGVGSIKDRFRSSDGKTHGALAFPDVSPLIFPALDKLAAGNDKKDERKRNKLNDGKNFVEDYLDRRAQAKYSGKYPDSLLAQQQEKPKFTSRYADPDHPASSGSLISLFTGGHVNPPPMSRGGLRGNFDGLSGRANQAGRGLGGSFGGFGGGLGSLRSGGRSNARSLSRQPLPQQQQPNHDNNLYDDDSRPSPRAQGGRDSQSRNPTARGTASTGLGRSTSSGLLGGPGIYKKPLKRDVLYLMIVNMPSNEELALATSEIEQGETEIDI